MAIIRINSNEDKENLIYESVRIGYGKNEEKVFSSGNFVKDWYDMRKFMVMEIENESIFTHSSSVDNFIMDGAPYDSAYLHTVNGKGVLKYIDRTNPKWYLDIDGIADGIEFFVHEGTTPTWEELKTLCE